MIIQELFGLDGSEQLPLPETQRSFHRARLLAHIHTTLHMVSPDVMVYSLTSGLWSLFQRNLPLPNVPKKGTSSKKGEPLPKVKEGLERPPAGSLVLFNLGRVLGDVHVFNKKNTISVGRVSGCLSPHTWCTVGVPEECKDEWSHLAPLSYWFLCPCPCCQSTYPKGSLGAFDYLGSAGQTWHPLIHKGPL